MSRTGTKGVATSDRRRVDFRAIVLGRLAELGMSRTRLAERIHDLRPSVSGLSAKQALSRWLGPEGGSAPPERGIRGDVLEVIFEALGLTVTNRTD
jgi:hypothetical protein